MIERGELYEGLVWSGSDWRRCIEYTGGPENVYLDDEACAAFDAACARALSIYDAGRGDPDWFAMLAVVLVPVTDGVEDWSQAYEASEEFRPGTLCIPQYESTAIDGCAKIGSMRRS